MPSSKVEQWLASTPHTSSDYRVLVDSIRSNPGSPLECVIETNQKSHIAHVEYKKTQWGGLFKVITVADEQDVFINASFNKFIDFCEETNLIFPGQDFLENTRKMLEIAKNAAQFKAISVPLNTPQDVEALLAIMDRANAVN